MSNQVFPIAREGWLTGTVGWTVPTIKVSLVRGYAYNDTHRHVSEVTAAGGVLHATQTLAGKTATNGVARADPVTFTTPAADANDHYLLIYQASAVTGGGDVASSSQRVIAWIDTATGLPIRPNGASISITWDPGTNGIFKA